MKLKRFFASFSLVLLLFSVSLVPCFADDATSSSEFALGINFGKPDSDPGWESKMVFIPSAHEYSILAFSSGSSPTNFYLKARSNYYKPVSYDRTVYVSVGYCSLTGSTAFSYVSPYLEDITYTKQDDNNVYTYSNAVTPAGYIYQNMTSHGGIVSLRITIPSGSNSFSFNTDNCVTWYLDANTSYNISSYGGYIIDSADDDILNAIEQILQHTQSIDNNTGTMVVAINQILAELRALNADTDTIVSVLSTLQGLSESQLQQLQKISTSVDAIYFFLTEALKSESEDASQAVQDTVNSIDNSHASEAYWQTSMQGNYDSLDLENFSFGGITGGIELVGRIFTDMWSAFGEYQILFTFPLVLGIALLVIGRISKFGGGNSSRNKEHKGGEGGA